MGSWMQFLFGSGTGPVRSEGWSTGLVYLEGFADAVLTASLILIPLLLLYFLLGRNRRRGALRTLLLIVSAAMLLGGLQHLASLFAIWLPVDAIEGALKAVAAVLTLGIAIFIWRRGPELRGEPSNQLRAEEAAHLLTHQKMEGVRDEMQKRIDRQSRELGAAEQRFELALRTSPITVFTQDADLRFTWVHNAPPGVDSEALIGKTDADILPPESTQKIIAAKRAAMETLTTQEIETSFEGTDRARSFYLLIEALQDSEGRGAGTITLAVDISQRKAQEMHLRLLLRELTHRSKNLLAVINAIARQTAARTASLPEFLESFNSRLVAIGAAHDLLVADDWKGASLKTLVEVELSSQTQPRSSRIDVEGEDVMIKPEAVQNLGLALHELATNARKHGALSTDTGEVRVSWCFMDTAGVKLVWQEKGGPAVVSPERRGFGRMMLENVVGTALDGEVSLDFEPEGVRCEITIPPSQLDVS